MRNRKDGSLGFSILGFLLFFITLTVTSSSSVMVYSIVNEKTNGNLISIALSVLATILIGALFCTLIDIVRRKTMIENPVKKILDATYKISSGDFNVKLIPLHDYMKYDEFDVIFENINKMTAELSKNELLKNDFISNVSHEIKTPLAIIQNYAKSLQNPKIAKDKREEYLRGLISQTNKLSNLISNILKLNKLENQELSIEMEEIDLAELVRVSALQFEHVLDRKGLELDCNIDEVKIVSCASLLEIVLNNLISNAVKFTDSGKISIRVKNEKEFVLIKIKDTGCGISNEIGQHMFDKFYQGDTSHSSEGNGLGLALVKKVIDVIGGEISVKSKIGKGSSFTIKLKREK